MTSDTEYGRALPGQALAVPVEPVARLDPPGFDPSRWMRRGGIKAEWLMEPVTLESAAVMAKHYGSRAEWGEPVACYCWTKETWSGEWDVDSETKAIAILFGNRRVMDMRFGKRSTTTRFYTAPAIATEARRAETSSGSVHEGAGLQGIAQPQSVSGLSHTGVDRG